MLIWRRRRRSAEPCVHRHREPMELLRACAKRGGGAGQLVVVAFDMGLSGRRVIHHTLL
jgi:hypothetical protein